MNGRSQRPIRGDRDAYSYFRWVFLAIGLIILGVVIASNLNLEPKAVADIDGTDTYPVVKDSDGKYRSPFVAVVERVQDAVVNISATIRSDNRYYDDLFWRFFQIPQEPSTSYGSGFFFREDGYILTNNHVIRNAERVVVRTSTGYVYDAKVVGADPQTDLAVLKVDPKEKITFIPFGNSDNIMVGDWSIAIGNPFPQVGLDRTVTVGVISAKGRTNLRFGEGTPQYQDFIQTDASINPGNSGGPLINLDGEAVGVNSAISSPSGGSVGIGFAIPINIARAIVPDLIESGKVSRGWLGVWLSDVTPEVARRQGLNKVRGVLIDSVFKDSPADRAGIVGGDILSKFNNHDITEMAQFSVLIATAPKNVPSQIEVIRNGKPITVTTTIIDRESYQRAHADQFNTTGQVLTWLGMELLAYTNEIAQRIGSDYFPGIYINRVARNSAAYRAGILPGSIITQIDGIEVKNLVDLQQAAEKSRDIKKAIPILLVDPRGSIEYKAVRP